MLHEQYASSTGVNPLIALRRAEEFNCFWHRKTFTTELRFVDLAQEVHLLAFDIARQALDRGVDAPFLQAYLFLMKRTITHYESFVPLFEMGNYGSCLTILRNVVTDYDMQRYLSLSDTLCNDWHELATHYKPEIPSNRKSVRWKKLEEKFRDSAVRAALVRADLGSIAPAYAFMSEAAHSTAWGTQFYATPDHGQPGNYMLSEISEPDPVHATFVTAMALTFLLQLVKILAARYVNRQEEISGLRQLVQRVNEVAAPLNAYLDRCVNPLLDVIQKIWRNEIEIPADPAEWKAFNERLLGKRDAQQEG